MIFSTRAQPPLVPGRAPRTPSPPCGATALAEVFEARARARGGTRAGRWGLFWPGLPLGGDGRARARVARSREVSAGRMGGIFRSVPVRSLCGQEQGRARTSSASSRTGGQHRPAQSRKPPRPLLSLRARGQGRAPGPPPFRPGGVFRGVDGPTPAGAGRRRRLGSRAAAPCRTTWTPPPSPAKMPVPTRPCWRGGVRWTPVAGPRQPGPPAENRTSAPDAWAGRLTAKAGGAVPSAWPA
jgi:hypothetical protein